VVRDRSYDAVVVGAGPNGLSAAITLSRKFRSVLVVEAKSTIGGGMRSAALTLPGFVHDVCSTAHPLGISSPFFRGLGLEGHGVVWIHPEIPLAHPFDDGSAIVLHRSLDITCRGLGRDGKAYKELLAPFVECHEPLLDDILRPLHLPKNPLLTGRFGIRAFNSARALAERSFGDERTRTLFAGLCAHAMIPLERPLTAAFGLVLALLAHTVGWPMVQGGSQGLADALAACLRDMGGEIETDRPVSSLHDLPRAQHYFFDITPRQLLNIEGLGLSGSYRRRLGRFRYGPGIHKVDWALREPIPWKAEACRKAGTVHLGSSFDEISAAIGDVNAGRMFASPYVVLAQQTIFDPSRAPAGMHTAWAYCHVPHGTSEDVTARIEEKIERFAPGFGEVIMARHSMTAREMEAYNANYVGGDINGGAQDVFQLYTRPVVSFSPYRTSVSNIRICSSSTPPGGGVHGLCGYFAARDVCS
jgi:phytoene dehydrogenase-like protein